MDRIFFGNGHATAGDFCGDHPRTCKWLVTPIYKPYLAHLEGGITLHRELTNHGY